MTEKVISNRAIPEMEIIPHPQAPLFSKNDAKERLLGLADSLSRGKISNDDLREVIRQAGFVSLWFFLKFIAGYANPFDQLNTDLHLDMCNFRQKLLSDGIRGAMFIPRGHYKSTVVTEGGAAWEIIRNPDIRIRITNHISDKAHDFMHSVKAIYDSNSFFAWLYPEFIPPKNASRWNETELVVPARTKYFREATVEAGGVGGASEGHHYDLHIIDDIIGLGDLNAMYQSGTSMEQARKWFWGSEKTLLVSMKKSRVIVVGTRYAVDDVYDDIISKSYKVEGYPLKGHGEENPLGRWLVYYRKGIENGKVIFPENFTIEMYREMATDDWWTFVTQYLNDPQQAGLAEFSSYNLKSCYLDYDASNDQWFVMWKDDPSEDKYRKESLSAFDVILSVDPAATEKYISAKTSRSAVGVLATHYEGKKFFIYISADYVPVTTVFDWIFQQAEKLGPYIRATYIESNAGFKVLGPVIRDEERRRGIWTNLQPFPAVGDKDGRIRSNLQPELEMGSLHVAEPYLDLVMEEQKAFPQSYKKDILDMMSNAVANSIIPNSPEEEILMKEQEILNTYRTKNVAGY
jgi:phage terminase large subunit-like protein